ncbi:MFS transporter [Schaalia sp. 19OD2882]|uniref:MFS transporter n=1 Tax=Schaalia sp. 19OD2882 TaxID=2794089 RepID=UPI001C1EE831|nr:MFS transporter [Schaalia sp. 19OD2882]QWW19196.1 MFS transporter [Schaalia sp. 19OD2882]
MESRELRRQVIRARWAVFVLFVTNGAFFANVVPRYPEVKDIFGLGDTAYGVTIAMSATGSLLLGPLAVTVMRRFASARTAVLGTIGIGTMLTMVGLLTTWRQSMGDRPGTMGLLALLLFGATFFVAGGMDAITDVGQNAHGLRVQRLLGRPVINSFHGGWSVGAMTGGVMGSVAVGLGIPFGWHLTGAALVIVAVGVICLRFTLAGRDPEPGQPDPLLDGAGAGTGAPLPSGAGQEAVLRVRTLPWRPALVIAALTVLAVSCMLVEDVGATWSALYMRDFLHVAPGAVGLAYVALLASQTIGRLTADWQMSKLGARRTVLLGVVLILLGAILAVTVHAPWSTILGMGLAGFGCAPLVPIAYNAADDVPGLRPGVGLTIVTWLCRIAPLAGPPLVGLVVEHTSLLAAVMVLPFAGIIGLAAGRVIAREVTADEGEAAHP